MISKKAKAAYDREYRKKNRAMLKAKKAAYFQRTYDPVKAAKERKKTMARHIEYCRRPEYRKKKAAYDRKREAEEYGEFAECREILKVLMKEIKRQEPDRFELYRQAQRFAWNPFTYAIRRENRAKERAKKFLESFRLES
jgi:hypothetical protein